MEKGGKYGSKKGGLLLPDVSSKGSARSSVPLAFAGKNSGKTSSSQGKSSGPIVIQSHLKQHSFKGDKGDKGKGKHDDFGGSKGKSKEGKGYGGCGKGGKDDWSGKGGKHGREDLSQAERKRMAGETVYYGTVRAFNPERNSGFIDCKPILQECGKEVYVFQNVLESCQAGPGDTVAFYIHWSDKGLPQASHPMIRLKCGTEGQSAQKGFFKQSPNSGHNFIECNETKLFFGRDVYVSKDIAANLAPGQPCCFNLYLNREGMPNADSAEALADEMADMWEPIAGDLSVMQEVEMKQAVSKGKGGEGGGGGKGGKPVGTGQLCVGMIKSFNEGNNYGFIESEEVTALYGCDAFLHGREFNGLNVGETVQFEIGTGPNGKPQAMNVESMEQDAPKPPPMKRKWNSDGGMSQGYGGKDGGGKDGGKGGGGGGQSNWTQARKRREAGEQVFYGTVKSFDPEWKNGVIECRALGQDIYVYETTLQSCGAGPGDAVAFFLHISNKGKPQAGMPMIRLKSGFEGNHPLKGHFKMGGSSGFIQCPEVKDFFGRDVYCNADLSSTLEVGQMVAFSVYLNPQGMPNADSAAPCDELYEGLPGDLSVKSAVETPASSKGFDKGFGKGKMDDFSFMAPKGKGKGDKGKGSGPPEGSGRVAYGFVKSFNDKNNYGFIECEELKAEYGCDTFMHGKEFTSKGLTVGEQVQFEVGFNPKGQPQALNVSSMGAAATEPPAKKMRIDDAVAAEGYDDSW
eukprot:TRINITY_DN49774_c0_g1_i1.p1 TRINITY_DN49774_c0_g1~~TRINITY_DN49774_c0_g1_i1.p1  ORF type:complete len:764 (-),score=179.91 TRINITY_DN49774_c0_g1_i1:46-2271(-)